MEGAVGEGGGGVGGWGREGLWMSASNEKICRGTLKPSCHNAATVHDVSEA